MKSISLDITKAQQFLPAGAVMAWKDKVADGTYLRGGSWGWDEANQKTMAVDSGTQMVIKGIALEANSGVKVYTYEKL